jgi:hypothetical protein
MVSPSATSISLVILRVLVVLETT